MADLKFASVFVLGAVFSSYFSLTLGSDKAYSAEIAASSNAADSTEETLSDEPIKAENLGSKDARKNAGKKVKKDILNKIDSLKVDIPFFPDWPVGSFDYFISPIVGFAAEKRSFGSDSISVALYEAGLALALTGIPVVPKNPGLTLDLLGGKAWGGEKIVSQSWSQEDFETKSSNYQRVFGKIYFTGYYQYLKWRLGVKRGRMDYSSADWGYNDTQNFGLENDIGLLILPFFSTHYTLTMDRVWTDEYAKPFLVEYDHWLHAKIASSTIKSSFDIGPGYTTSKQTAYVGSNESSGESSNQGGDSNGDDLSYKQSSSYVKAQLSSNPFWKFALMASAKYILSKDGDLMLFGLRLPEEGLYDPKEKGLPADSLAATWFLGLNRFLGGMGAGYQVNLTITNMGDKEKKTTTRTSGWVVNYSMGL